MNRIVKNVINIVIGITIISSCNLKEESLNKINCINIEHIGARDGLKYKIAVGFQDLSCGFKIENVKDSMLVRNFKISDSTFNKFKNFILDRQVDSDEISGDAYSGYRIKAFNSESEVLSYYIIGNEKYHNYFNALAKTIGSNSETDTLNYYLKLNGYYWKQDSVDRE